MLINFWKAFLLLLDLDEQATLFFCWQLQPNHLFFWRSPLFCSTLHDPAYHSMNSTILTPGGRDLDGLWTSEYLKQVLLTQWKQTSWEVLSFVSVPAVPALTQYSPYPLVMGSCHSFPSQESLTGTTYCRVDKEAGQCWRALGCVACDSLSN